VAREEAGMTDIDLIDWTIQEAQHLKTERREPSDLDGRPSLEKLLTVLEREPVGPTSPEDPVAQIASALSWQRHRGDDRLQMAWRHVDDEPLHLAGGNLRDLVRHRVDVPVPLERRARAKQTEYIFGKGAEVRCEDAYGQKIETAQRRQLSNLFGLGRALHNKLAVGA